MSQILPTPFRLKKCHKGVAVLLLFLGFSYGAYSQQWSGNNNTTDGISRTGKVGIGTTAPAAKLHVTDGLTDLKLSNYGYDLNINTTGGWARNYSFSSNGNVRAHMGAYGSDNTLTYLYFDTDDETNPTGYQNPEMVIMKNGNVGIGLTNPQSPLHITSSVNRTLRLDITGISTGDPFIAYTWQSLATNSVEQWRIVGRDDDDARLEFWNKSGQSVLSLLQNGNVGIGTISPGKKLEVSGDIRTSFGSGGTLTLYEGDNSRRNRIIAGADFEGAYINSMYHTNGSSTIRFLRAGVESMRITSNGNVGIGTITPSSRFHVVGQDVTFFSSTVENTFFMGRNGSEHFEMKMGDNHGYLDLNQDVDENNGHIFFIRNRAQGTSPDNDIRFQTASTDRLTIKGSGNVGIGTISPASTLHVSSSVSNAATIRLGRANSLPDDYLEISTVGGGGRFTQTGGSIDFYTSTGTSAPNNFSMRITGNGNVGIGTTNPGTYKLAVEGKIGARSVKVTTASWADYVFASDYTLMSLPETEAYIKKNQHLPNIPSAAEVKENGFHLEEMDAKLLAKIEELTLYIIEQEKRIKTLEKKLKQ